jgi:hypothetical protein
MLDTAPFGIIFLKMVGYAVATGKPDPQSYGVTGWRAV